MTVCWFGRFYHFTVVLAFTNSFINPLIYAAKYREFQNGVRRLMAKVKLNQQQAQVSPSLEMTGTRRSGSINATF